MGESLASCYVFGDSTNDLSMLTHVKNSIAMGNSYPEILANTSYVTTPIERDGIRNALKHFGLIYLLDKQTPEKKAYICDSVTCGLNATDIGYMFRDKYLF